MRPEGFSYGRFTKGCMSEYAMEGLHFWHLSEKLWVDGCINCGETKPTPPEDRESLERGLHD